MMEKLKSSLAKLNGCFVDVQPLSRIDDSEDAAILLIFPNSERIRASYWRIANDPKKRLSNFDHLQKYGLPRPMNAIEELQALLRDKGVVEAGLDEESGDVIFRFEGDIRLQLLNLSGYEVWEFYALDGDGAWSNYA
jgi:hypothetical protein